MTTELINVIGNWLVGIIVLIFFLRWLSSDD
jgi:hypothetical protein